MCINRWAVYWIHYSWWADRISATRSVKPANKIIPLSFNLWQFTITWVISHRFCSCKTTSAPLTWKVYETCFWNVCIRRKWIFQCFPLSWKGHTYTILTQIWNSLCQLTIAVTIKVFSAWVCRPPFKNISRLFSAWEGIILAKLQIFAMGGGAICYTSVKSKSRAVNIRFPICIQSGIWSNIPNSCACAVCIIIFSAATISCCIITFKIIALLVWNCNII